MEELRASVSCRSYSLTFFLLSVFYEQCFSVSPATFPERISLNTCIYIHSDPEAAHAYSVIISITPSTTTHLILILRIRPHRRDRGVKQLCLRSDDHAPTSDEPEVRHRLACKDLAEQQARLVPHVHAVTDTGVDIAVGVAMDAVRESWRGVRERLAGGESAVFFDAVAVAFGSDVSTGTGCGVTAEVSGIFD